MFLRALLAFLALPGLFAFILPPILASLDPWRGPTWAWGFPIPAAGVLVVFWCVRDFSVSGKGTLAPWDPPKHLVVVGLFRYVRNPMYIGVILLVLGWALVLGSPLVGAYTAVLGAFFHFRVVTAEEPWLSRQFPSQWPDYAAAVPRWIPRATPWQGLSDGKSTSEE